MDIPGISVWTFQGYCCGHSSSPQFWSEGRWELQGWPGMFLFTRGLSAAPLPFNPSVFFVPLLSSQSPGQPDPGEAPSVTGLSGHGLAPLLSPRSCSQVGAPVPSGISSLCPKPNGKQQLDTCPQQERAPPVLVSILGQLQARSSPHSSFLVGITWDLGHGFQRVSQHRPGPLQGLLGIHGWRSSLCTGACTAHPCALGGAS